MAKKKTKKNSSKNKKQTQQKKKNPKEKVFWTAMIMVLVTFLFFTFCYFSPTKTGTLGNKIHTEFLLGFFANTMYLFPFLLLGLTIYVFKTKDLVRLSIKAALSFPAYILLGAILQLFQPSSMPYSALHAMGKQGKGGGVIGGSIGLFLSKTIGPIPAFAIIVFLLFVLSSLIFKISYISIFRSFISGLKNEINDIEDVDVSEQVGSALHKIKEHSPKKERKAKSNVQASSELDFEIGDTEKTSENKSEKSEISEDDLQKRINQLIYENTDTPVIPVEENNIKDESGNVITETLKKFKHEQQALDIPAEEVEVAEAKQNSEAPDQKEEKPERVSPVSQEEKAEINKEIDSAIETPVKEYEFPPIDLLATAKATSADKRREMSETAKKLMDILKNFGVEAKLQQVTQGPTVTRYEIQPSTGVKLSKIQGLAEDIALNLAVSTVLVAPVPGKAAVGIEVPNTSVNTVSVRELIESDEYKNGKSKLTVAFGKDIGGNVVVGDIAKMPHVLIAGSTGSGKSVCINTIIVSLLYKAKPDEVKLIMVDPKVVELSVYNGIPHLLIPVVTDPKRAAGALNWAVGEMMRRYSLFAQTATRNLDGYNNLMVKKGEEKLPQIVIIIDELADLMMVAAKEVEEYICRLAQLARAAGIHLIIATQRPSVDVITGLIKANVPSRIAFAVSSQVDSRTILDKGGAEKLLGRGDMLYHPAGLSNAKRVQGAFVSDDEISSITDFVKSNSEDSHYSEDLAEHIDNCANGDYGVTDDKDKDDDADELLPEAIDLALELGQISTAMIQRRLKVGYARAGRIIDQMEMRGLISGANGSKPREVYRSRITSSGEFDLPDHDEE